jgi:hypothetical protein
LDFGVDFDSPAVAGSPFLTSITGGSLPDELVQSSFLVSI